MLNFLLHTPLLSLFIAPLTTAVGDRLHQLWSWLDGQKAWVKQVAAIAIAFVFVAIPHLIAGFTTPAECTDMVTTDLISSACEAALTTLFTSPGFWLQVITAGLGAIAVKHGQQSDAQPSVAAIAQSIVPLLPASKSTGAGAPIGSSTPPKAG